MISDVKILVTMQTDHFTLIHETLITTLVYEKHS